MEVMSDTKARIIKASIQLFRRQGYEGTGLKQIVEHGRAPWGSLYHFFPKGKEQLAIAALKSYGEHYQTLIEHIFKQASSPIDAVNSLFASTIRDLLACEFTDGCPIVAIALDKMNDSETLRHACAEVIDGWVRAIAFALVGDGIDVIRAVEVATSIIAALEGGNALSRIARSTVPLAKAADMSAMVVRLVLNGVGDERPDPGEPPFRALSESDLGQGGD